MPAALTLRAARAPAPTWTLFGVGAVVYAEGHGQHLAANSIGNTQPGDDPTIHLRDEVMGHYVWYAGVVLVVVALVHVMQDRPSPRSPIPYAVALAARATWGTNAVGGQTPVMGVLGAVAAVVVGLQRGGLSRCLAVAGAVAVPVVLVGTLQGYG